jgi:hypothetical protein
MHDMNNTWKLPLQNSSPVLLQEPRLGIGLFDLTGNAPLAARSTF